jgi:hypothetical protein
MRLVHQHSCLSTSDFLVVSGLLDQWAGPAGRVCAALFTPSAKPVRCPLTVCHCGHTMSRASWCAPGSFFYHALLSRSGPARSRRAQGHRCLV